MTHEEFTKAATTFKRTGLKAPEKHAMLARVLGASTLAQPIESPWSAAWFMSHRFVVASLALFIMTGSTTLAAANSLPGDPLYAMKVNVIEPLALAAQWNEEERLAYRIELLQERVRELEQLRAQGRVDTASNYASFMATEHNLLAIENTEGMQRVTVQTDVATQVNTYNALSAESFRLTTTATMVVTAEVDHATATIEADAIMMMTVPVDGLAKTAASTTEALTAEFDLEATIDTAANMAPATSEVKVPLQTITVPSKPGVGF